MESPINEVDLVHDLKPERAPITVGTAWEQKCTVSSLQLSHMRGDSGLGWLGTSLQRRSAYPAGQVEQLLLWIMAFLIWAL